MKNIMVLTALFYSLTASAQVSQDDVDMALRRYPFSDMQALYIKNVRTYYVDGSSTLEEKEYASDIFSISLTPTSILLYRYEDSTKTTDKGVMIFPYAKIIAILVRPESLTIEIEY